MAILNSHDARYKFNIGIYLLRTGLFVSITSLLPNAAVHGFLLEAGVGYVQIGMLGSVASVANAAGLFLFSGISDRFRKFASYKSALAFSAAGYLVNGLSLVFLCALMPAANASAIFFIYAGATAAYSLLTAVCNMLEMTLILRAFPGGSVKGRLLGVSGVAASAFGVACGFIVRGAASGNEIASAVAILGALSCAAVVAVSLLSFAFFDLNKKTEPSENEPVSSPFGVFVEIIRTPQFKWLTAPNLFRAAHFAAVFFFAASGLGRFENSQSLIGFIAIAVPASGIIGCLLFALIQPRAGTGSMYLGGAMTMLASVIFLAAAKTEIGFASAYFGLFLGQTVIDYSFPLGIYETVPAETVGRFSAVRNVVYMAAFALFTFLFGIILDAAGPSALYASACAALVFGGGSFFAAHKIFNGKK